MIKKIIIVTIILLIAIITLLCLKKDKEITVQHEEIINEEVIIEEKEIKQEISSDNNIDYVEKLDSNIKAYKNTEIEEVVIDKQEEIITDNKDDKSSLFQEYIDYCKLTKKEQYDFYKSFSSSDAFLNWYKKAKEEYEKDNPTILLKEGEIIDLKD